MSRSRIALLMTACLIALAVACSSGETDTPVQQAPTSAPASSAQAQPTTPPPTIAPAPTSAPSPTAAAVSTSTSVPAAVAATATSAPAPTAAPASPAPQSAATSDAAAPATVEDEERDLEIVTLLPFDAIPAILEPEFISVEVADEELEDHNLVLGLSINDDHRAYSIPTLSAHEIVNDTVGGKPVAVTW